MASQFVPSPVAHCSHVEQPGIIVPPLSAGNLTITSPNPVLSNSPCPDCALHTAIIESMMFPDFSGCHHLHASSSCSSCYSNHGVNPHVGLSHGDLNTQRGQCGHMQQSYDFPQKFNNNHLPAAPSYPAYSYNDWPRSSNNGGYFMPPLSHTTQSCTHSDPSRCNQFTTPMGAIPLPSPTLSIPPITPFVNIQEPIKTVPIQNFGTHEYATTNTQENYYQNENSQNGFIEQQNVTKSGSEVIPNISDINISDVETKPDIKSEKMNPNKRKLQKSSSDKRKNKPSDNKTTEIRKRQPEDVCQVCGDRASGYHYNALTCEGCKGFFRRSITNKTSYKQGCKQGGNCEMDTYTRRKCPFCRLKKCKEVGMLEECLLTEIQCQSKRRRRKQRKEEQAEELKQQDETSQSTSVTSPAQSSVASSPCGSDSSQERDGVSLILTDEESQLIDTVTEAFKHYKINPEIVKRWEKYINKESNASCRLSDISTVHVQVLVEYAKNLPGFHRLESQDQISILKGCVFEAMLIRNSCGYNHLAKPINMPGIMDEVGVEAEKIQTLVDFFSCIGKLNMDETEYALLIAVVLFNSDYPKVKNKSIIDEYQDLYVNALAKYSLTREPIRPSIFAKMLATLTEIRSLTHFNAEIVTSWKKRGALTPLLCEIWDLE